jgi:hypothetical protein
MGGVVGEYDALLNNDLDGPADGKGRDAGDLLAGIGQAPKPDCVEPPAPDIVLEVAMDQGSAEGEPHQLVLCRSSMRRWTIFKRRWRFTKPWSQL